MQQRGPRAMKRRQFLEAGACAGLALAAPRRAFAADAVVVLSPGSPGPLISPHVYGHFVEHLGGVVYDGIWVGRDSKIPNVDGQRKQFVDDMKRIGAPNLRWPGGCLADGYHWRDGIGPSAARPRTYNYWEHRMPSGVRSTESNFERPDEVTLAPLAVEQRGDAARVTIPPKAVVALELRIG